MHGGPSFGVYRRDLNELTSTTTHAVFNAVSLLLDDDPQACISFSDSLRPLTSRCP